MKYLAPDLFLSLPLSHRGTSYIDFYFLFQSYGGAPSDKDKQVNSFLLTLMSELSFAPSAQPSHHMESYTLSRMNKFTLMLETDRKYRHVALV